MGFRETIFTRCTTFAGLAALIVNGADKRCYTPELPEEPLFPSLVYREISDTNTVYRDHDGATGRTVHRIQFDCWDEDASSAAALAAQVKAAWDGYSNKPAVGYAFVANTIAESRDDNLRAYRVVVDIILDHEVE